MIEKAYAKINIGLNVFDKREDGYHNLETVMLPLELHDSLSITIMPTKVNDDYITVDEFSLKIAQYNLCHEAINLAREKWKFTEHFRIEIHKNIYLRAGLGGGSADAAAVIRGIVKLLKIQTTEQEIIDLCIKLGSDVPFCYFVKPALVSSVGQKLEFFEHDRHDFILLVKPITGLSTKDVFEMSDKIEDKPICDLNKVKKSFIEDNNNLNDICTNGLYCASKRLLPEIEFLLEKLKNEGFDYVSMTGSGSTIACFTKDKKFAESIQYKYYKLGYQVELTTFYHPKESKIEKIKSFFKKK